MQTLARSPNINIYQSICLPIYDEHGYAIILEKASVFTLTPCRVKSSQSESEVSQDLVAFQDDHMALLSPLCTLRR